MKIFYRLSDASYKKQRFQSATKANCLRNFLEHFNDSQDELNLVMDKVKDETVKSIIKDFNIEYQTDLDPDLDPLAFWAAVGVVMRMGSGWEWKCKAYGVVLDPPAGSSAASFRVVMEKALELDDSEMVLFQEDDYWHLDGSRQVLLEGLERVDYCSLYLHGDRFVPVSLGGNKFVDDTGSFSTRVFCTQSSFWCQVESTTMTFATQVKTLREDQDIWRYYTQGNYPRDFECFLELAKKGRSLATPIPTRATHCEPKWASPVTEWSKYGLV